MHKAVEQKLKIYIYMKPFYMLKSTSGVQMLITYFPPYSLFFLWSSTNHKICECTYFIRILYLISINWNSLNSDSEYPLEVAAKKGSVDIGRILIKSGAKVNQAGFLGKKHTGSSRLVRGIRGTHSPNYAQVECVSRFLKGSIDEFATQFWFVRNSICVSPNCSSKSKKTYQSTLLLI